MPLQIRRGATHQAVVSVIGVVFQVAIIALGVVVIERVLQAGAVIDLIVEDRAQPVHTLLITAIGDVVVLEAAILVDLHGVANRLEQRRAPVRAVFLVFLILQRQGVAEVGRQVAEDGEGHAGGLALIAIHIAVAAGAADVEAGKVFGVGVRAQRLINAQRQLRAVIAAIAQTPLHGLLFAVGQFGDVVDRAAHGAGAVEKGRRPTDQLHPVINPGIHRPRGAAVAHANAVIELGDLPGGKAAVRHIAAVARVS